MTENYDVKYILSKGGCTQIRYTVCPADAEPEENIVSRADKPHEDFRKLWTLLPGVAARFLEFPLQNADGQNIILRVTKVNFLDSTKYGYGMQLVVLLEGMALCPTPLQIVTQKFYCTETLIRQQGEKKIPMQLLLPNEKALMKSLKEEAFKYAYCGKRQQPTIDEAQRAYERGGYLDEE